MASEWTLVGTCKDLNDDEIAVKVLDHLVMVGFLEGDRQAAMIFGMAERDAFIRLWADAERQAEAYVTPPEEVVEAEIWCGLDGCPNGPGEHLWTLGCLDLAGAGGTA